MATPTPRKPERPVLWLVAGPNGSGKSTFYNRTDIEGWGGSVWIVNPDLLTRTIVEREGVSLDRANLLAVERVEQWLYASVAVYQTIGVETVLSTDKYRRLVKAARERSFHIRMIYVLLRSAELQVERVRRRVAEGGHDVPEERIRARRARSFEQLAWFLRNVDQCFVFDNSTGGPEQLIDMAAPGDLLFLRPLPDDLQAILEANGFEPTPRA
jgi:predicted ABC-type ATPase